MRRLFFIFSMLQLFIVTANAQVDRQHIRQGNKLYRQEKYDKAEVEYQKALAANQRNLQPRLRDDDAAERLGGHRAV